MGKPLSKRFKKVGWRQSQSKRFKKVDWQSQSKRIVTQIRVEFSSKIAK